MGKSKITAISSIYCLDCIIKIVKVNINKLKEGFEHMTKKPTKNAAAGFSLIESLLSLSFFLIILAASLGCFISTRNHFIDLKDDQEINQAGYATLDKIRLDLCECGFGLVAAQYEGLLEAINASEDVLTILSKDKEIHLGNDLVSGQTFIPLASTAGIKKGQKLCFIDHDKGEVKTIALVNKQGITLDSSLDSSYSEEETTVILVRTITFYLDADKRILRRKVNTSPAQPLIEDVVAFAVIYGNATNVISLELILKTKEEKKYESSIFLKNMALVPTQ